MGSEMCIRDRCKVCRRREAVYKRLTSGELLCRPCLYSGVVKQVRRAMSYYAIVHRGERALFIVRPDRPLESIISLQLFLSAARDLELEISILCYSQLLDCTTLSQVLTELNLKPAMLHVTSKFDSIQLGFLELLKFSEAIAHNIARKHRFNAVLTPLYRDELALLGILGLLKISRSIFSEALPVKLGNGVRIARPFLYVASMDVLYLAYTSPTLIKYLEKLRPYIPALDPVEETVLRHAKGILWFSTELMYSSSKSVELLQSYILGSAKRCRFCLAHSDTEVCEYCSRLLRIIEETRESTEEQP